MSPNKKKTEEPAKKSRAKRIVHSVAPTTRKFWEAVKRHRWKTTFTSLAGIIIVIYSTYGPIANECSKFFLDKDIKQIFREISPRLIPGETQRPKDYEREALVAVLGKYGREIKDGKTVPAEYLLKMGNLYFSLGDSSEAEYYFEKGLQRAKEQKDEVDEAVALANLATLQVNKGSSDNLRQALDYANRALAIHRNKSMIVDQANDLATIGEIRKRQGEYAYALRSFEEARRLYAQETKKGQAANMALAMGRVYVEIGDNSSAISFLNEAKHEHMEARDQAGEATDLFELGKIRWRMGDRKAAIRLFREARAIFANKRSAEQESETLSLLGRVYVELGDYDQALNSLWKSQGMKKESARATQAENLFYMGHAYSEKGSPEAGIEYMQMALRIATQTGNSELEARALHYIGLASKKKGDTHTALQLFEDARLAHNRNNDKIGEALDVAEIGFLQRDMSRLREARVNLEKAIKVFREEGCRTREAHALGYLGLVYADQGDWFEARRALWQAKRIREETRDSKGAAETWIRLAKLYRDHGELDSAQAFLDQAREEYSANPDELGQAHLDATLGLVYKDRGDFHGALRCFTQAHEVFQRETGDYKEEARVKSEMAIVRQELHACQRPPLDDLRAALALHRRIGYKVGEATTLGYIGRVLLAQEEPEQALIESEKALKLYQRGQHDKGSAAMNRQIGVILLSLNAPGRAEESFKKALGIYKSINASSAEAEVLLALGVAMFKQDETTKAVEYWESSQKLSRNACCRQARALNLACQGALSLKAGKPDEAAKKLAEATEEGRDARPDELSVRLVQQVWQKASSGNGAGNCPQIAEFSKKFRDSDCWTLRLVESIGKSRKSEGPAGEMWPNQESTHGQQTEEFAPFQSLNCTEQSACFNRVHWPD